MTASRRATLGIALLVIALGVAGTWWWRGRSAARPNILLITIDTLRADRVGAYGARGAATPALDRIAREGVRFDAAYAAVPLTLPSHTTILSGLLPAAHTVRTNDGYRVPSGVPLVAESLRDAGYDTGAVVASFVLRGTAGLSRGFAHYDDEMGPGGQRRADVVAARARAWLEQPRSARWFLWVHFFDPHLDYDPPEPYRSRYADRAYDGEVAYVDASVQTIVELLEKQDLLRTTVVIVAADHGEALGDHGEASHGALLYDPVMRVPLLLRLPSGDHAGRAVAQPVGLLEIAPTIRELAGVTTGRGPSGLLAQLRAEPPAASPPVSETLYLKMLLGWSPLYSLRVGRHKIIDAPVPELYDLEADPLESRNLARTEPARTQELLQILRAELQRAADRAALPVSDTDPEAVRKLASLGYLSTRGGRRSVAPVGGPAATSHIELWRNIEEGLALSHRGEHREAARVFEGVLIKDADNVLALKFLGGRALEVGDLARAVALNERVAASGLHVADALSNLVLAYDRLGRGEDALGAAGRALDVDPDHVAARYNRAIVLAGAGRSAEAAQDLDRVLSRDPEHAGARALRARLQTGDQGSRRQARSLAEAGNLTAAVRVLEAAVAQNPRDAELHDDLGIVRSRAGDLRGARAAFERALALNPQAIDVRERLGAVLHRTGDRDAARTRFEEVLALMPTRPGPRLSLAILDLEQGNARRAVERLEPITQGWEGAHQAWFYLGEARMALADRAGARRAYQTCIDKSPRGDPVAAEAKRRLDGLR